MAEPGRQTATAVRMLTVRATAAAHIAASATATAGLTPIRQEWGAATAALPITTRAGTPIRLDADAAAAVVSPMAIADRMRIQSAAAAAVVRLVTPTLT